MNKLLATMIAGVSAFAAFQANAEERWPLWYVSVNGGWSTQNNSDINPGGSVEYDNNGGGFSAALGYRPPVDGGLFGNSRVEAEFLYVRNGINQINNVNASGDVDNAAGMINLLFDIPTGTGLTPYIGAGIGVTQMNFDGPPGSDGDDYGFAGQFKAGLAYTHDLIPHVDFQLGYRYLMSQDMEIRGVDVENDLHMVEAGARFNF